MLMMAMESKIHREIRLMSKEAYQRQWWLAVIVMVNLALAISVNELCSRSAFPSQAEAQPRLKCS